MKLTVDQKSYSMPLPKAFLESGITYNNIIHVGAIKRLALDWYILQIPIKIPAKLFVGPGDDIRLEKVKQGFVLQWDWTESVCSVDSDLVDEFSYDISEAVLYRRLILRLRINEMSHTEQQVYDGIDPVLVLHNNRKLQPMETEDENQKTIITEFLIKVSH